MVVASMRDGGIIGRSRALRAELAALQAIALSSAPVHIQGETGTGKEVVARALHRLSGRANNHFVVQNCAAISDSLLQSILFGHRRGSFTGAERDHVGIFEAADGGTLFLDEIGDMSLALQAAVLRAIDCGELTRVGETATRSVDVRVISATHRDMRTEIAEGRFREDLYYRLSTFELDLPPLRSREGDVAVLAKHFLEKCRERTAKDIPGFTEQALHALEQYTWPGNVRQLECEVERACTLNPSGKRIDVDAFSPAIRGTRSNGSADGRRSQRVDLRLGSESLPQILERTERHLLDLAMRQARGNKTRAAAVLGISRQRLDYRLRRHGLSLPSARSEQLGGRMDGRP